MVWRVVRVFHGLMSSVELQSKQREAKVDEERQTLHTALMESRRALAKSKVFYFSYFIKLTNRGVKAADQKFFRKNKGFRTAEAAAISEAVQENGVSSAINAELAKERIAKSEAEAMFIALYDFLETHHEHLKIQENRLLKENRVKKQVDSGTTVEGKTSSRERFKLITNALKVKSSFEEGGGVNKDKRRSSYFNAAGHNVFHLNTHLTSMDEMLHLITSPTLVNNVGHVISSHIPFHHSASGSSGRHMSLSSNSQNIPLAHSHSTSSMPSFLRQHSSGSSGNSAGGSSTGSTHHIVQDVSHMVHSASESITHHMPSFLHHSSQTLPTDQASSDGTGGHIQTDGSRRSSRGSEIRGESVSITVGNATGATTPSDGGVREPETCSLLDRRSNSNEMASQLPRLVEEDHSHSIKMIDIEHSHGDSLI